MAKLTDALNRVRIGVENQVSAPAVCGKAFFSIRNGKYSTALESLLNVDQEEGKSRHLLFSYGLYAGLDGQHLIVILKMVCYAHLHIIKTTMDLTTVGQ